MNRSFGKFIQIPYSSSDIVSALKLDKPEQGIYCFRIFESPPAFLPEADISTETLKDFVIFERFPTIMEVGKEALDIAQIFKCPIIIVFYDTEALLATIRSEFEEFAKSLRRKFIFSYSQGFNVAQNVGFDTEKYPLLSVYDLENNRPYLMDPKEALNVKSVQHFLDNMAELDVAGKMSKSEEPVQEETSEEHLPTYEEATGQKQPSAFWAALVTFYLSISPLLL